MSAGRVIEIYKETGLPEEFAKAFALEDFRGTHALGHTRMATESRVTTEGSHPFSTGLDLCLVHNGSLSNHNRLRQNLRREGIEFQTENDTEVAAGYLAWRLREGASLEQALEGCLDDLDGFYTFAVGTADGFAVLRDPIACKPAVLAETEDVGRHVVRVEVDRGAARRRRRAKRGSRSPASSTPGRRRSSDGRRRARARGHGGGRSRDDSAPRAESAPARPRGRSRRGRGAGASSTRAARMPSRVGSMPRSRSRSTVTWATTAPGMNKLGDGAHPRECEHGDRREHDVRAGRGRRAT